jgi:single-stranded DNA-binding protein
MISSNVDAEAKSSSTARFFWKALALGSSSYFNILGLSETRERTTKRRAESCTEWHRCVSFGKLADFAATLKKGAHVQVEGELRGREYEKDGVKHKVFECRLESILKLDRAERRGELISKEGYSPPRAMPLRSSVQVTSVKRCHD